MSNSFEIVGTVSKVDTLFELLKTPEKLASCDVVELRFDEHMIKEECLKLCKELRKHTKILLTIRTDREGGTWTINDEDRFQLFKYFEKDVDMIDIELKSELFASNSRSDFSQDIVVVGSFHDYEKTPENEEISDLISQGKDWQIDIVKLAVFSHSDEDVQRLATFLNNESICLIGMGEHGVKTRVGFPTQGSCLTYGYLDDSAAPGQLSAQELKELLRA
ncbi:MAG: type I 3-dehydroquinate dehydratase [Lentisphaerales bacterium]|nr:type I 3-dehydroquinate dehydratase [Lentisphaerales bacterium]